MSWTQSTYDKHCRVYVINCSDHHGLYYDFCCTETFLPPNIWITNWR